MDVKDKTTKIAKLNDAFRQSDLPQNWWTPKIWSIETVEVFYENEEKIYRRVQG